jgi:hypothetical protein
MQPVIPAETLSSAAHLVIYVVTVAAALMSFLITCRA